MPAFGLVGVGAHGARCPTVERATVLEDVVKRGSIVRQVREPATLVRAACGRWNGASG